MTLLTNSQTRLLTLGLGVGTVAFGAVPFLAPRTFARTFGLPIEGPEADLTIRSVGARDAISGIGIISALMHGGRLGPWLLARALSDFTDAIGVALALRAGARNPRLVLLGLVALGAAAVDVVLYLENKRAVARIGVKS